MRTESWRRRLLSNLLVRLLSFVVLVYLALLAYIISGRGIFSDSGSSSFLPGTETLTLTSEDDVLFSNCYSVFEDFIVARYLSPDSKSLCVGTLTGQDAISWREIGVKNSIGIFRNPIELPFDNGTFDFVFSGAGGLEVSPEPAKLAAEASRTLKHGGFFAVHTVSKDMYSLNSLLNLFSSCKMIRSREINGVAPSGSSVREIVLKKENTSLRHDHRLATDCYVPEYKKELIRNLEDLIYEEPLKPWIALKKNVKNIRYLPSMVDISFKNKYVYVDVGPRNYTASIGSWFKEKYPKQNKPFEIYAIEPDKVFHAEYRFKKRVTFLPYAAWVRNETLFFRISRNPTRRNAEKGRRAGRIPSIQSSSYYTVDSEKVAGFDFASWLKKTVSENDFVVVKMDAEGVEFHLVERLVETGAICLIDELFIVCHYGRWWRCCYGERSSNHERKYAQCLELFSSLRKRGVLVHQWW